MKEYRQKINSNDDDIINANEVLDEKSTEIILQNQILILK